jgi:pSer/pThr/pTyr-binding forkhead associated (FHA) protein
MHTLRFTAGPLAGRRVQVTSALLLGRQAGDLVLDDPQVSRRHASVRPAGDALEVEDHGSRNGTWVNGARVGGVTRLAPGDQVRLGDTVFEVEGTATGAAPTEASPRPAPPATLPFDPPPQRPPRLRRGVASRRLTPTLLSFGTVILTAIALVLYFAMRSG